MDAVATADRSAARLPPFVTGPVVSGAAALGAVLLLLAPRYGPHRDELYFVSAGRRLAWGYPDQPALTPALARLADEVAPGSLVALRLSSAVAAALIVVIATLTARELGGGRSAQLVTAVTTGTGVIVLVVGHLLSTTTVDVLCWTAVVLFGLRALMRDRPQWWLAVGLAAGIGLENKHLVVFLLAGLALGVALTSATRHHLRTWQAWAGAGIALLLWLPNLAWQAANGWPQFALAADIREEYSVVGERIGYVALLLVLLSPLAAPLWIYGLVRLFRNPAFERARPVAWAFVVCFAVFLVSGGKAYYLAPLLPALIAAGVVELARRWSPRRMVVAGAALALAGLIASPIGLPVLPVRAYAASPYVVANEDMAETIGWPAFADVVRGAVSDSGARVVFTQNYGQAGAAEFYGVGVPVFSGHNGFGDWGPPPEGAGPVVVVGRNRVDDLFAGCSVVATVDNGIGLRNEEQGAAVRVCAGPIGGWRAAWPQLVHLDA